MHDVRRAAENGTVARGSATAGSTYRVYICRPLRIYISSSSLSMGHRQVSVAAIKIVLSGGVFAALPGMSLPFRP